jgi:hypothetical protein
MEVRRKRKTIEIPEDAPEQGEKPAAGAKREPFLFFGAPSENRPVVLRRDEDGNPTLTAPPKRYWIKLGGLF